MGPGYLLACSVAVLGACTEPEISVEDSDNPIDQLFAGLGTLPVEPAKRDVGTPSAPVDDGDYQCVTTPIDEVRHHDQLLGQLAVGDVLWPGSLVRGDTVYSGQLTPLVFERAPLRFSISLESLGSGARSATLPEPSLSSYRDAIGRILDQQLTGSTPARISAEVEEIESEEQLAVALGTSVSAPLFGSVKASFDFDDSTKRSRYLVKFFQLYYTVDVDPPSLPHQFFGPSVRADDVAAVVGAENPPVYVSSIGYGRQVVFSFESELSKKELQGALSFVYQGGVDVSGNVSLTHREVLSHTKTTAFILGGDGGGAVVASIGSLEELRRFISEGGNYSKDSPGAAIAYKLSYVRDHTPVKLSYASAYSRRECSRITQKVHVVFESVFVDSAGSDSGGDLEIFGSVFVRGTEPNRQLASWAENQYIQVRQGQSFPTNGIIGEAIIAVQPQPGNAVRFETTLLENDTLANDSFGDQVPDAAPFEAGWRRQLTLHRSSGSQQISLRMSLTPVP
jgi:thiol-activated cytolysin